VHLPAAGGVSKNRRVSHQQRSGIIKGSRKGAQGLTTIAATNHTTNANSTTFPGFAFAFLTDFCPLPAALWPRSPVVLFPLALALHALRRQLTCSQRVVG
jgi:hypothetical protein